jgi:hypothetical protein
MATPINTRQEQPGAPPPPRLRVRVSTAPDDLRDFDFVQPFRIGRLDDCEVCIKNEFVSRVHADVTFENGQWWVRDLNSANGIFVGGQRVEMVPVEPEVTMRLGVEGPIVSMQVELPPPPPPPPMPPATDEKAMAEWVDHYFGNSADREVGERTMMVRMAYQHVQKKQRWKFGWIVGGLVLVILIAGGYALYLHQQVRTQTAVAQNIFYSMKSLDLDIANVERLVMDSNNQAGLTEIRKYQDRRKEMEKNYDQFLSSLKVYNSKISEQDQLILRIARIFGECELAMPPGFVSEVQNYIKKWQSSDRLTRAIRNAATNGYTATIARDLLAQDLPPQFFYLALQESDFDPYISGPMTRKGIAKGMWQFIPETAVKYGLKVGPLVDLRRPDPGDDRHHWDLATVAAARYIKDLYSTDAQASGFLVMACYNWGENQVLPLVRSMPANPRERNFWKLLSAHRDKLPQETYDYVFYIASAAVIGENPRLFGFDFDNPLARL